MHIRGARNATRRMQYGATKGWEELPISESTLLWDKGTIRWELEDKCVNSLAEEG